MVSAAGPGPGPVAAGQPPAGFFFGQLVQIAGLASRPEMNGAPGQLVKVADNKPGRYLVKLATGQTVSLKPENLILPAGARAQVVNLTKGTQWNSKVGKVCRPSPHQRAARAARHRTGAPHALPVAAPARRSRCPSPRVLAAAFL